MKKRRGGREERTKRRGKEREGKEGERKNGREEERDK